MPQQTALVTTETCHSPSIPPLQVFLVEDLDVIRDNLIVALSEVAQARVVAAVRSEPEAVAWLGLHKQEWELAVVDLFLRQGSGLGVLRACRSRAASQRVVVLTNFASKDVRARCLAQGADAVFDKSTEIDDFLHYCQAR